MSKGLEALLIAVIIFFPFLILGVKLGLWWDRKQLEQFEDAKPLPRKFVKSVITFSQPKVKKGK